jgi:TonB-like protein
VTPLSPPRPLRQVLPPAVPAGVILYKDVQVQIQLNIDERGRVITARPSASPEKVSQSLLGAALKAATQWQFQPATLHGQPVGSEYTVIFEFHPKQY